MALWMNYHKVKSRNLVFPYTAKSPTLKKKIVYTELTLWEEIDRILAEDDDNNSSIGQKLYYNLLFCSDPSYFLDGETNMLLEEYVTMKRFSIPLARSLDEAEYARVSLFSAIDEEYNNCKKDA